MFKKLFGSAEKRSDSAPKPPSADKKSSMVNVIHDMKEKEDTLEKRKDLLEQRINNELQKARDLNKAGKKPQALMCLKKKKLLEKEVENLDNMIMRLIEQRGMLEASTNTADVVSTMSQGVKAHKENMKNMNIDNVDEVLDEIAEANEQAQQINDALAMPTGLGAQMDDSELNDELEMLGQEDLDAELLEPASVPKTRVEGTKMPSAPTRPVANKTPEELELEALQAEMAS